MKYVVEIPDEHVKNMEDQKRYLDKGGSIWIQAFSDDASEFVHILSIETYEEGETNGTSA